MSENEISTEPIELTDIRDVRVDRDLPRGERVAEFVRQLRDPYHYKCGKLTITAHFDESGPTLEECLIQLFT
ncbi:MAG: hypothetical protein LBN02_04475 [Oscillospiraceae bacterium]|jgi:hypothetical protein|nr:hypothetical protein [Oscillospiraceae bacterium]